MKILHKPMKELSPNKMFNNTINPTISTIILICGCLYLIYQNQII